MLPNLAGIFPRVTIEPPFDLLFIPFLQFTIGKFLRISATCFARLSACVYKIGFTTLGVYL